MVFRAYIVTSKAVALGQITAIMVLKSYSHFKGCSFRTDNGAQVFRAYIATSQAVVLGQINADMALRAA